VQQPVQQPGSLAAWQQGRTGGKVRLRRYRNRYRNRYVQV